MAVARSFKELFAAPARPAAAPTRPVAFAQPTVPEAPLRPRDAAADDDGRGPREGRPMPARDELLDPATRATAQLAPPQLPIATAPSDVAATRAVRSLEELLPDMVRRIAWSGDGKRGSVRLELGRGPWTGAVVLVHADGASVRLEVTGRDDAEHLRAALEGRLARRGIALDDAR